MHDRREQDTSSGGSSDAVEEIRENSSERNTASLNSGEGTNSIHANNTSDTTPDNEIDNAHSSANLNENDGNHRTEANIFDRFMDSILGYRNRVQSPLGVPIIGTSGAGNTAVSSVNSAAPNTSAEGAAVSEAGQISGSANTNSLSTSTDSNGGAIVITVNYVFSDENNPQNPNRTGSLVMTLPNNSSNRDPRIIQEFIRLATLMAYSTIVNLNKDKGITIDKFNSFEIKTLEELKDTSKECSICFEEYVALSDNYNKKRSITEGTKSRGDIVLKKRKLDTNEAELTSAPSSSTASTAPHPLSSDHNSSRPKYLSEFTGTFEHIAVQMPCGHIFGKSCLFEWLKSHSSCPLCRDSVRESNADEAPTTVDNNTGQNHNPNITFIHRPGLLDIFNSFSGRESNPPVRRILRSGNGLSEQRTQRMHTNVPPLPDQVLNTNLSTHDSELQNQSGVFSNILNYLRRSQQEENSESLFPAGVSSRRTTDGVETRLTDRLDSDDNMLELMNLRSLVDENNDENIAPHDDNINNSNDNINNNNNNDNDFNNNNGNANDTNNQDVT